MKSKTIKRSMFSLIAVAVAALWSGPAWGGRVKPPPRPPASERVRAHPGEPPEVIAARSHAHRHPKGKPDATRDDSAPGNGGTPGKTGH